MAYLIFFMMLISACSKQNLSNPGIKNYNRASYFIPKKLDPMNSFSTIENSLCELMLEGLFKVNKYLEYEPQIVSKWSLDKTQTKYNFKLRDNILFHNGERLNAKHVKENLDKLFKKNSPVYNRYKRMKEVKLINDFELSVSLDRPYPPFLALLSAPASKIYIRNNSNGFPIGTGPFKFIDVNEHKLSLIRFSQYYGLMPKIEKMNYVLVNEKQVQEKLISGIIHDSSLMPYISSFQDRNINKIMVPAASTWIVAFNTSRGITKSKVARNCLIDSFNKNDFIKKFIPDHQPATGFLPPSLFNKKIIRNKDESYNCAKSLSGKFKIDIPIELDKHQEICSFFSLSFKTTGVIPECKAVPFNILIENIRKNKSNAYFLAQTLDLPYIEYFLETFQDGSLINLSSYTSETYNKNLDLLRSSSDRILRISYVEKLNSELLEMGVTLNVSYPKQVSFWHQCLEGYSITLPGEAYINYQAVQLKEGCKTRQHFQ